ncbi:MAG: hypothetical protein AAGA83_23440 [Cyanobacteria bacterium P01_F01_bin.116]
MKSKLTSKRAYKKPSLKTHGNVEQLTKGVGQPDPIVGSGGAVSCPPSTYFDGRGCALEP